MDDLDALSVGIREFAEENGMVTIPVIPGSESAPAVRLEPRDMLLPEFLGLARQLGDQAIYVRTEFAGTDPETGEPEDLPGKLARRKGKVCDIAVAFASARGILHVWSCIASWWQEWLDSQDAEITGAADEDAWARQEEHDQADRELAAVIVADAQFRAGNDRARRRRALQLIRDSADPGRTGAVDVAFREAADLTEDAYCPFWEHPGAFAAEFLTSPEWRLYQSPKARREVAAVEFLTSRADGWRPTGLVCEELYAQATKRPQAASGSLF